jgi:hypothetical protein
MSIMEEKPKQEKPLVVKGDFQDLLNASVKGNPKPKAKEPKK